MRSDMRKTAQNRRPVVMLGPPWRPMLALVGFTVMYLYNAYWSFRLMRLQSACPQAGDSPLSSSLGGVPKSSTQINEEIPDWHHAIDCSVWDNMCLATSVRERRYAPYPFPLGRHIKNLREFHHEPISDVPAEWRPALNKVDKNLDHPPSRPVLYVYPPEVPAKEREGCIQKSMEFNWKDQIDGLMSSGRVRRESTTNMVAFTISDFNYARDMMHDVFEMNTNIVGYGGSFFMVALDRMTVDMACKYGYPLVAWPSAAVESERGNQQDALKHAVANTKFEVSLLLASRGIDFLFYEMDVWFLRSPKQIIFEYHRGEGSEERDILASSHVKDPMDINIGVYSVTANEQTREYFGLCIQMSEESPGTHDQWIMGQLLLLAWTIHQSGSPGLKLTRMWKPPPKHNPPEMKHPPRHGLYNTMEIMAGERPYPTRNTIAIHTLCAKPLNKAFGKKIMAKELGAWAGFAGPHGVGGYYSRIGPRHRRYLWMDGHDSPSTYNTLQSFEFDAMNSESMLVDQPRSFRWAMALLLALARRTGRIFVMPRILGREGAYFLWTVLDFGSVEEMGIDFRETNFPSNARSWAPGGGAPYRTVARTALAPLREVDREGTMYVRHPADVAADGGGGEITRAWRFDENTSDGKALDSWWALHTAIPEMDSAELLLVNPHFLSAAYVSKLEARLRNEDYSPSIAEGEIARVYGRLRWCGGEPIVMKENVVGRSSAELSCNGRGVPPHNLPP